METKHLPFISADSIMKEFSLRAVLLGVFLAMFMGAANAYLGLKAGMTIAAVSAILASRGSVRIMTLPAIAIDDFIAGFRPPDGER